MHHRARLLFVSLLIYLSAEASGAISFPKLRDIAETFESSAELTDLIQNTTAVVKEYYDFADKTGRLDFLAFGVKLTYFIYGNSEYLYKVYTVNDTACKEEDADIVGLNIGFYGWNSSKDPMYVGPSALILMKEKNPPEYSGQEYVRGIYCDRFHYEETKDGKNFKLDYYFAVPGWDMPWRKGPNKSLPVRIRVYYYGKDDYQDEVIDYLYFRPITPELKDKSKFQPPVGLGCKLKEPKAELPYIPKQYAFSVESFDLLRDTKHEGTGVNTAKVWYDSYDKVARIDQYTTAGKISDLYDFSAGVRYHMHDDRTCVFKAIRASIFTRFPPDSNIGTMKDPYEVLNLQGEDDFYTMGQAEIRGVKCNVIEKVEYDISFYDETYKSLVTTAYFTAGKTSLLVDGEDIDFSPPLLIIITGYGELNNVTFKQQFHIYSFDDEPAMKFFWTYPSDECFPASNQKSYFVIMIDAPVEIAAEVEGSDTMFETNARNTIIREANISEFRLPFLRADYRESGIYITGLMLDKPPALAQFWKELDEPIRVTTISAYEIDLDAASEEACAVACLDYTEPCTGFHFCGEGCFINLGEITDKPVNNIDLNLDCYIYIRGVMDSKNDQASLKDALDGLTAAAENKKLGFPVTIKGEPEIILATMVLTSFNNRGGDDVSSYPYTLVKAGYQFQLLEKTVEAPDAQSEEECYRQCKTSTSIACASFSYCAKASNKMCRLTSVLLDGTSKDDEVIDDNPQCDIFSLLFLDFFDPYPGKVLRIPGNKISEDAFSTETCAKACKEEKGFKCRGFEYCKSKKQCTLHEKHVMDLKPEETASSEKSGCVHYAAKFIADYRNMGPLLVDDESNRRTDITLEECARACSEEVMSCNSFNYCPPTQAGMPDSSCSMTSMTLVNATKTKVLENCFLYTRRENIEDWRPSPRKSDKSGYTKGDFAGLLIGMIILGLVVGALLFVGYSCYRSRTGGGDGLTVKFSKHENT